MPVCRFFSRYPRVDLVERTCVIARRYSPANISHSPGIPVFCQQSPIRDGTVVYLGSRSTSLAVWHRGHKRIELGDRGRVLTTRKSPNTSNFTVSPVRTPKKIMHRAKKTRGYRDSEVRFYEANHLPPTWREPIVGLHKWLSPNFRKPCH